MRLALAFLALASPAAAQDTDMIDTCSHAAGLAETIMVGRQSGVPVSDALQNVLPLIPDESRGLMQRIILAAYEHPRFSTEKYQQREITEFQNSVFLSCMDAD